MSAALSSAVPALAALPPAAVAKLAAALTEREVPAGGPLFAEGDAADAMYFIVAGTVRIEKQTGGAAGGVKTLALLGRGDPVGEMALFDGQPRSATAVAEPGTRLVRMGRDTFHALLHEDAEAGAAFLFAMIRAGNARTRRLNSQVIVFHEIGKAIGESARLDTLLEVVVRQLVLGTGADGGGAVVQGEFTGRWELRAARGLALDAAALEALGGGVIGRTAADARPRLVADLNADAEMKALPRAGWETPSLILQPVVREGRALGVLFLTGAQPGHFDLNDLNLCASVASQTAQAILVFRHREEEAARTRHSQRRVSF